MSESRKQKLNKIINDLHKIKERLEKIEQDIENPNNLLLIGAPNYCASLMPLSYAHSYKKIRKADKSKYFN